MGGGEPSFREQYSESSPPGGLIDTVNQGLHELELQEMLAREKRLDPDDRYVPYRLLTRKQAEQWERSFESDPGWRLNKGAYETWSYSPLPEQEKLSSANQQLKDVLTPLIEKVHKIIKPSQGTYSPDPIPMKSEDDGYGQRHFDPTRSSDAGVAQLLDAMNRLGVV